MKKIATFILLVTVLSMGVRAADFVISNGLHIDSSGNIYVSMIGGAPQIVNSFGFPLDSSGNLMVDCRAGCAPPLTTGTSVTLSGPSGFYVCTGACSITPTVGAGNQYCVFNGDNVNTAITFAAISGVQYELPARTSYKTANTALASAGAVKDFACILGLDATHFLLTSSNGTWS